MNKLKDRIETAINSTSAENGSNTPDFILAEFLTDCLAAFDKCSRAREKWYGHSLQIGGPCAIAETAERPAGEAKCPGGHDCEGKCVPPVAAPVEVAVDDFVSTPNTTAWMANDDDQRSMQHVVEQDIRQALKSQAEAHAREISELNAQRIKEDLRWQSEYDEDKRTWEKEVADLKAKLAESERRKP